MNLGVAEVFAGSIQECQALDFPKGRTFTKVIFTQTEQELSLGPSGYFFGLAVSLGLVAACLFLNLVVILSRGGQTPGAGHAGDTVSL